MIKTFLFYLAISFLVTINFLKPGAVFLLDMTFISEINISDFLQDISPQIFYVLILKLLSSFVSLFIFQKFILITQFALAGHFSFKLARNNFPITFAFLSGLIYMLNPWTYERFLSGQWYVYLGYGIFPLFIYFALKVLKPGRHRKDLIKFIVFSAIYPLISLHWAFIAALVFAVMLVVRIILYGQYNWKPFLKAAAISIIIILLVNSFWLFGGFFSKGTYNSITSEDFVSFQTASDPQWGTAFNVLSLYGFWNRDYTLPKDTFPYWWVITFIYLTLASLGAWQKLKHKDILSVTLCLIFLPVVFLSMGAGHPWSRPIVEWLGNVPLFKGLRETEKLVGVIAFTYAWFIPFGLMKVSEWIKQVDWGVKGFHKWSERILAAAMVVIISLSVNSIFRVMAKEVAIGEYPQAWADTEQALVSDQTSGKVLVLPWWAYVRTSFSKYHLISNPARRYFTNDVVVSTRFEGLGTANEMDKKVDGWLEGDSISDSDLEYLKGQGITHIILMEEQDSPQYHFLDENMRLERVIDEPDMKLYKIH